MCLFVPLQCVELSVLECYQFNCLTIRLLSNLEWTVVLSHVENEG
jgi:hypothetical protein